MNKLTIKYCLFQRHADGVFRFGQEMTVEWFGSLNDNAVEFVSSCYPAGEFSLRSISGRSI